MSSRLDRHMEQLDKNREMIKRVEYCQENGNECNDWEDDFLESIHNRLMKGIELSDGQSETLEKIEFLVEWGRDAYWKEFGRD
jgi:hypothetical protein